MLRSACFWMFLACVALMSLFCVTAVCAEEVTVRFYSQGQLVCVQSPVPAGMDPAEAAVRALVSGPTQLQMGMGITSAIPAGVTINHLVISGDAVEADLSAGVVEGLTGASLEAMSEQFRTTLGDFPWILRIKLTSSGKLLEKYLPSIRPVPSLPRVQMQDMGTSGVGLAGKKIGVGPSHGRFYNGSGWYWMRSDPCAFGEGVLEDTNSINLCTFLNQYLTQDGAEVVLHRTLDKSPANGYEPITGYPWWKMCAQMWLRHIGAPPSVWCSYSGNTGPDDACDRNTDDLYSRPLWMDYHNTDIYISHHTNAGGSGTATGTETFRYSSMNHPEHVANSLSLATAVQSSIVSTIRSTFDEEPNWADRGVKDNNFAEIRIPDRPAILIELAFHDDCSRDALYLKDDFFRSLSEWAVYKGICTYFGNTPTWDKYSCEYVSDTIPETMVPGQVYDVSVTLRNRGVCWFSTRGFKLIATANNDAWFRSVPSINTPENVKPGETCTFNFQLTGPSVGGVRTTEWRMVRDGYSSGFGPTITKTVDSGVVVDNDPPTVPQNLRMTANTTTSISIAWDASVDAGSMVEGYTVYRDGVAIGTVTGTTFTDTGRVRNTVYSYEVDAYDSFNNRSAKSDLLEAQVIIDNDPPTVPQNLRMTAHSSTTISLAWDESSDAGTGLAGYTVYRDGVAIGSVTGTTYTDTGRTQNTTYTYEVDAYDVYVNRSAMSAPLDATTMADALAPTVPQSLCTTAVTHSNVALAWDGSTDNIAVTGYTIYRNGVSIGTTAAMTYNDTGVAQSSTYVYEVDAYDQAGNHSAKSNSVTASTSVSATWGPYNLTGQTIYYPSNQASSFRTGWYTTTAGTGAARVVLKAPAANMTTMPAQALCTGGTFTVAYTTSGTYSSSANNPLNIYRITSSWTAGASTLWNTPWTTAGGDYVSVGTSAQNVGSGLTNGRIFTFNPTGTNAWFPNGVLMKGNNESSITYRKGWASSGPYPTLRITYTPPTPTIRTWAYLGHYAQGVAADHVTRINTDHVAGTYNGVPVTEATIAPGAADGVSGFDFGNDYGAFKWKSATATDDVVSLLTAPFYNMAACDSGTTYAAVYVHRSTATGNVYMGIGSDDDVKVYVNGTLRGSFLGASGRGAVGDQDFFGPFSLPNGWSRLLVKVENGTGGYGLYARFANADRTAVAGITTYTSDTTAPTGPSACIEAGGAADNVWQPAVVSPSFSWSGAADLQGPDEGVSGIRGYKVYFGADPAGAPDTFVTSAALAPGAVADGTYYLRVAAVDYALNESAVSTLFTFKKDSLIGAAKARADSAEVIMEPAVVTAIVADGFYMEDTDRSSGIKVLWSGDPVEVGEVATVVGAMDTDANYERQIIASSVTTDGSDSIAPLVMTNRAVGGADWSYNPANGAGQKGVIDGVGLNNIGLLVRTNGYVTAVGSDYIIINDGSEARGGSVVNGVKVACQGLIKPAVGQHVVVTGISTIDNVRDNLYRCILVTSQDQISLAE